MIKLGFRLVRPLLHHLDAETAHHATIAALKFLPVASPPAASSRLSADLFGLRFPNPLGLAPGFDKNGDVPDQMLGLGFGFVEVGTTTPKPQAGNPRPRLFRLAQDQAVINRMGFNNDGHMALAARLAKRRGGIVGVNIGANKDTDDRGADYVAGVTTFGPIADYLTVNISSPNTPGLRGLQSRGELTALLARLNDARAALKKPVPMLLKIAPDLVEAELEDIASCCLGAVDGVIISNTTISRPPLRSDHASETGGLSGAPLFDLSTRQLAKFYLMTGGQLPLIGAGGIASADAAWRKIEAGASLLQLYSALVFHGPALIADIVGGLERRIMQSGLSNIREAVGLSAKDIAYQSGSGK
jgi:dihydroorotate dehydrogenase